MASMLSGSVRVSLQIGRGAGGMVIITRGIAGKDLRKAMGIPPRPAPYPWKEKRYTSLSSLFDWTTKRFSPNTKVISIEGPPAVGKTAFAAKLAEELDMLHVVEPTMDMEYINDYGFDMRTLDPKMPESCKTYDHKDFCKNPKHMNAANFQICMYQNRYTQYIDSITHLLSTGQGVVVERCPWSDFVFAEAMVQCKYMSKGAKSVYDDVKANTISELHRPHLVIYLDIPVSKVKDNVRLRNNAYEQNSEVMSTEFLTALESSYKQNFLKQISISSEVLVYDWTVPGDIEAIVEDIEAIDFDCHTRYDDPKLQDWSIDKEMEWADMRIVYSDFKFEMLNLFNVPRFDVPELMISAEDSIIKERVINDTPCLKFLPGYNAEAGDTGLLFKNKISHRQDVI